MDQKCFYCKQAIANQKENKIVVNSIDDEQGECAVPSDQKQECKVSYCKSILDSNVDLGLWQGINFR